MGSVIESVTDPIFVLRKEPFNMDDLQPLRVDETPTYDRKAFFVQGVRVGHTNEKHHYELVREDKDGYYIYKPKKSKKTIYGIPCPKPFIITENIVPELEAYTKSSELKDHITNITPKAWEVDKASYSFIGVSAGTCLGYGTTLFDFSQTDSLFSSYMRMALAEEGQNFLLASANSSHLSWSSCNDVSGKKGSVFHNFCENHSSVIPDHTGIVRALFDDVDSGIIIPI